MITRLPVLMKSGQEFPSYTQYEVRSALAKCGLTTKHIESQVQCTKWRGAGESASV